MDSTSPSLPIEAVAELKYSDLFLIVFTIIDSMSELELAD
jgi:hypothetical protein